MAARAHGESAELLQGRDGALQHLQRNVCRDLSGLAPCQESYLLPKGDWQP